MPKRKAIKIGAFIDRAKAYLAREIPKCKGMPRNYGVINKIAEKMWDISKGGRVQKKKARKARKAKRGKKRRSSKKKRSSKRKPLTYRRKRRVSQNCRDCGVNCACDE